MDPQQPADRLSTISATFIRRPVATVLLAAGLLIVGVVAFFLLPRAVVPDIDLPTIVVSATLPGASPEIMASNVAAPLERAFSGISGLAAMSSSSALGGTDISLQFELDKSINVAAEDVQAAISAAAAQLPPDLPSPPTYRKTNPADMSIITLALDSDILPITDVANYGENVFSQAISRVEGVGSVMIFAPQRPAIRIQIDPAKIAALGIDLEAVRSQILLATVNAPKGSIDGPHRSMAVYDDDQIVRADDWDNVIVAFRNGAPVRIGDIGTAVYGPENAKVAAYVYRGAGAKPEDLPFDHARAVILGVTRLPGANIVQVADRVKMLLPSLKEVLPPAIKLQVLSDRTVSVRASVSDVEFTLGITVILVVIAIFVFLRDLAATVIPSVTIPLAACGTWALMYLAHFSLDNFSLMALTIGVGFVVDDAIVMLENIFHHVERGDEPFAAALKGSAEISFTVISISISLIVVFLPIVLMGGVVGRMMREFAFVVAIMVFVSVVLSLTLTPMLCARFLAVKTDGAGARLFAIFERGFAKVLTAYVGALRRVLANKGKALLVFAACVAASAALYIYLPKGFFPQQDTRYILLEVDGPQDSSMQGIMDPVFQIADIVKKDPDVRDFTMYFGEGSANAGNLYLVLKPKGEGATSSAEEVIARLRPQLRAIPGVSAFMQVSQEINAGVRTSRTQYQYTLTDTNLAELYDWAPRVLESIRTLPQVTDVASDQQTGAGMLSLSINRDQAARFGIQPSLIDATIYDAIGQRQVTQYFTPLNSYHVVLEVRPDLQRDPDLFKKLYVTSPLTGGEIPLSSLINVNADKTTYLSISHQEQYPAVTISFNLARGTALGDAVAAIETAQRNMNAPQTLHGAFQGSAQAFRAALASQPYLIIAALFVVYIVLGVLYENFIHPLTILSTFPSAGVGALILLWALGYGLDVVGLIGILLLIGIVKKNGIMMVDFAIHAERDQGLAPEEAVLQACERRFRPIMMTTACALFAGVPLALGHGPGSEIRQPLGVTMIGGLLFSQVLTLFTTPVIYLCLDRIARPERRRLVDQTMGQIVG